MQSGQPGDEIAKQTFSKLKHMTPGKFSVPDYTVSTERLQVNLRMRPDELAKKGEHPVETLAKATRAMNDAYRQLTSTEVLLTNLPTI